MSFFKSIWNRIEEFRTPPFDRKEKRSQQELIMILTDRQKLIDERRQELIKDITDFQNKRLVKLETQLKKDRKNRKNKIRRRIP